MAFLYQKSKEIFEKGIKEKPAGSFPCGVKIKNKTGKTEELSQIQLKDRLAKMARGGIKLSQVEEKLRKDWGIEGKHIEKRREILNFLGGSETAAKKAEKTRQRSDVLTAISQGGMMDIRDAYNLRQGKVSPGSAGGTVGQPSRPSFSRTSVGGLVKKFLRLPK